MTSQVCQNVNLYGFDPPDALPLSEEHPFRYFDRQQPPPAESLQAEFMMLRALHSARYITLCTVRRVTSPLCKTRVI